MKIQPLGDWERSHNCGTLRIDNEGTDICLMGWVNRSRDHGGIIFVDLRDRYGVTQIVFDPAVHADIFAFGEKLRNEYVIAIRGAVRRRPPDMENPKLATGAIEVLVGEARLLNTSETLPIVVNEDVDENENIRLRYRYLDLRRERMQRNLIFRSGINRIVRNYFFDRDFLELETPVLTRSTPEGARDFLVPSRLLPGNFYALPQSPQLFKQTLMASGFDKYFQVVKCYRDEDLRADRQPEHTQIDVEMSFPQEQHIFDLIEGLITMLLKHGTGEDVPKQFPRITYDDAMLRYGSDKPDIRFDLPIVDVTEAIRGSDFKVFENIIATGGCIRGINVKGGEAMSRGDIDALIAYSQKLGSSGLAWMRVKDTGLESNIVRFFKPEQQEKLIAMFDAKPGDLLTFLAGKSEAIAGYLGNIRLHIINKLNLQPRAKFCCCWVTDFPMFEWDAERKGWAPMHHIFTMPRDQDLDILETDQAAVKGRLYDLVINGTEIGSGSIRVHIPEIQRRLFKIIGLSNEEAERRFGFLLEVFKYGAPPHGGIGLGLDRLVALMLGEKSIRDVIPFPKTQTGSCLMTGAPDAVDDEQLKEVGIRTLPQEKKEEKKP